MLICKFHNELRLLQNPVDDVPGESWDTYWHRVYERSIIIDNYDQVKLYMEDAEQKNHTIYVLPNWKYAYSITRDRKAVIKYK